MAGAFINYRTGDGDGIAILLDRVLSEEFGTALIFRAGRSVPPGENYGPALLAAIRTSDVVVAVVGSRWLTAPGARGGRAVDDPADWTRRELAAALAHGVPVIPVLLGTTPRLIRGALPADLSPLAGTQYLRLDHHDVDAGLARLIAAVGARAGVSPRSRCGASPGCGPPRRW